jgi:flagella basal body P-ring formation protein FlgA
MRTHTINAIKTLMLATSFALFIAAAGIAQGQEVKVGNKASTVVQTVEVPVIIKQIRRGQIINPQDVAYKAVPSRQIRENTITHEADLIGREAVRNLRMGHPIINYMVRIPATFKRGETVDVVYQKGTLRLLAEGTAMSEGNIGEWVRIKNLNSGSIVRGLVQANGSVKVN